MESAINPKPSRLALAAIDIKLAHSVFALPFAILGGALAVDPSLGAGRVALQFALIVVCMVSARTWAMLVNRLADAKIDAGNPRTANRAIASGRLSVRDGWMMALASAGVFVAAASAFWPVLDNPWPAVLSLPVLGFIALYSYTKRFTALCHLFLGAALAVSPLAAALAINPAYLSSSVTVWAIAGFVLFWVAGFDMIYALQDIDFDRQAGLNSVPARLGWRGAIWISRVCHAAALGFMVWAWQSEPRFGEIFAVGGLVPLAGLLIAEHIVLAARGKAGLSMVFFTFNGLASVVLGLAGLADIMF
ncbi:MAG TPA: 4-hydroxybenzoate octaprenyltransferase [Phycisphaerales bacterium]|nr:4-hydroxybenzoate octaprenyltransferase [Phycisphaerales bacterium]